MIPILYVDDEPGMLEAVALSLENTGRCSVDTALSPALALTMLSSHQYEAIISDYDMPDMNGIVFYRRSEKDTEIFPLSSIPVLKKKRY